MSSDRFHEMKVQQAQWLAKEAAISEHEALQIVERAGFDPISLRREARMFKQSKRLRL
ncbi:hypothetical protein [Mesorhizobium sp. CN2-181]|uniref:hypothetical protein n=1 Tax=Mesorhizobium yinganensis TaxID=3157707 RepID=UPI0032B73EBA